MFHDGEIEGVVIRPLKPYSDARGWLIEIYREDELAADNHPVMGYVSETLPGVVRGPHEHVDQSDYFAFIGPGDFRLYLWDWREASATYKTRQTLVVGHSNRAGVVIPPGVVHAYKNISPHPGWVLNLPNRLYAGEGKKQPVDEIRHEEQAGSLFVVD